MGRVLRRIFPPAIVALFGIVGCIAFVAALSAEPWSRFAHAIFRSATPPPLSLSLGQKILDRVGSTLDSLCPYGLATSRVSVAEALLRRSRRSGRSDESRAVAASIAQTAIRDALACQPMSGQLWYELAFIERFGSIQASRLIGLLDLSRRLTPMEAQPIIQRSALMAPLIGRPELGSDLRPVTEFTRALNVLFAGDAVPLLRRIERSGRPEIAQVLLGTLPEEHRVRLAASLAFARAQDRERSEPRQYEFTPFGIPDRQSQPLD